MKNLLVALVIMVLGGSVSAKNDNESEKRVLMHTGKNASATECTKAAGKRKGIERQAFIEGCRHSRHTSTRTGSCSEKARAEGIHGATREQFMENCRRAKLHTKSR